MSKFIYKKLSYTSQNIIQQEIEQIGVFFQIEKYA